MSVLSFRFITVPTHVSNTISYHRVIGLANLRNVNNTAQEKKSQDEAQSAPEQDSSKKLTEDINKLNAEIAQLTEKNSEILVSLQFSTKACETNYFYLRTSTKEL